MVIRSRRALALITWVAHTLGTVPRWRRVVGFAFPPPLILVDPDASTAAVQDTIAHEQVHVEQWAECALVSLALVGPVVVLGAAPLWVGALAAYVAWPALYVALWAVWALRYRSARAAYLLHPCEAEARLTAGDPGYLTRRKPFAWVRFAFGS